MESKQGWTTEQVNDLIVHESGIHYHYTHVYRLLYKWGFKQKVPRKVHVNTASKEEKIQFKKEPRWFQIIYLRNLQQYQQMNHSSSLTASLEKYGYFKIQGQQSESQVHISIRLFFGAISLDGRQLFRQYNHFNEDTFCEFLKEIHHKFPKCYLFLDKAPQHYKSCKVRKYFEEHKDTLIPVYLPTASPEFMVLEECWNISKNDLLILTHYRSFAEFRTRIGQYFRTKQFNFNMYKYLTGYAGQKTYANWFNYKNRYLQVLT